MHRDVPGNKPGTPDASGHGNGAKEHKGLGEKLKSKLHKTHASS